MVSSGMADVGYQYVNIDGCWTNIPTDTPKARSYPDQLRVGPARDTRGNILPNKHFPDMKALTDYIHSKGLFEAPWPATPARPLASAGPRRVRHAVLRQNPPPRRCDAAAVGEVKQRDDTGLRTPMIAEA